MCVSRMGRLKVLFLVSLLTWLHLVDAAPRQDSAETNEADHSHSAGGCDCMEYWTCVMRYRTRGHMILQAYVAFRPIF
jgi:hypothetical protein